MSSSVHIVAISNANFDVSFDEESMVQALGSVDGLTLDSAITINSPESAVEGEGVAPAYTAYLANASYKGSVEDLRMHLFNLPPEATSGLTVNVVEADFVNDEKKLVIMDVDSTLIEQEVIDELAAHAGRGEEIALITERAMQGELNFEASLKERVKQLAGTEESAITRVYEALTLTPGATEFIRVLHEAGHTVCAVSGGFVQVLRPLAARIGLDYARANTLEVANGVLTGEVSGEIITPEVKRDSLKEWMKEEGFSKKQVLAIGDGANDVLMLKEAALGVAFNAKARLKEEADVQVNIPRLDAVRHFLGL